MQADAEPVDEVVARAQTQHEIAFVERVARACREDEMRFPAAERPRDGLRHGRGRGERSGYGQQGGEVGVHSHSGAQGRNRTGTAFRPGDFKSPASTSFATRARSASYFTAAKVLTISAIGIPTGRPGAVHDLALEANVRALESGFNGSGSARCWRRESESNRRPRLCRPLHDHSAIPPHGMNRRCGSPDRPSSRLAYPHCAKTRATP
jgi:hypothetical protein